MRGATLFCTLILVFVCFVYVRAASTLLHKKNTIVSSSTKPSHTSLLSCFSTLPSLSPLTSIGTVELGYGTPYLLSLGIPKTLTPLVWLAGPLSGLIIQPVVGVFSDTLDWKFGRRRPFILIGAVLTVLSMYMVAYAKEIAQAFVGTGGKGGRAIVGGDADVESAVSLPFCFVD